MTTHPLTDLARCSGRLVLALATGLALAQTPEMPVKPAPQDPLRNRLGEETSPYLRQHATNPVHWFPWCDEAFALAKELDRPIFLSIGYAACHWCHVMEHESFENAKIAALMNAHYICVKVDREERPDLDEIYMAAVQAMGIGGGWPLSVWLTPEGQPFYGGTYFPPEDRYGRQGFPAVLGAIAAAWRDRREELEKGAGELTAHLADVLVPSTPPGEPTAEVLAKFLPQSRSRYDPEHGGFAPPPRYAPKFPHASELSALMRLDGDAPAEMVTRTLDAMRARGMYDQLGGGFHRYSTDREWLVPHFEKMLYDNALLAACYLEQFARTGNEDCATVARETLDYMLREMRDERGGFWSSQDADSEGEEGHFFVWSAAGFDAVLGEAAAFGRDLYGVTDDGNWEGTNVLVRGLTPTELAAKHGGDVEAVRRRAADVRTRLLEARAERVRPGTDDKILCAWNGMAIAAFAAGYRMLGDARYLDAARAAADFVLAELVQDGRCLRSWHSGKARHAGYLEDHAMLADALLSLFECDFDPRWLRQARGLLRAIDEHFGAEDGGFWFTADDHEQLLARSKSAVESSTPSGAAVAIRAFLRAGVLLGDEALYERGVRGLRQAHALLLNSPVAASSMVLAAQFHLAEPALVIIAGDPADAGTRALLERARRAFPGHQVTALVNEQNREALEEMSAVFADKGQLDGKPAAYVCRWGTCEAPVTDPARLRF